MHVLDYGRVLGPFSIFFLSRRKKKNLRQYERQKKKLRQYVPKKKKLRVSYVRNF